MNIFMEPSFWASLLTLTFLEIVLGIDNIVFISIASSHVPKNQRARVRNIGLWLAFFLRALMLIGLVWLSKLSIVLFQWPESIQSLLKESAHHEEVISVTAKDIILFLGGLFLLAKGTWEIHETLEGEGEKESTARSGKGVILSALFQIVVLNIIFSLDSIITAIGMTDSLIVMLCAILISTLIMIFSVEPVSAFIERHPTTKMLALSFILLIGIALIADGFGMHIPRGYLYFAIAFSLFVEFLNIIARKSPHRKKKPVISKEE